MGQCTSRSRTWLLDMLICIVHKEKGCCEGIVKTKAKTDYAHEIRSIFQSIKSSNKPAPCDLGSWITLFVLNFWQYRLWTTVILLTEWQSRSIKSFSMSSGNPSKLDKSHFLCKRTNVETSKRLIRYPNAYKKCTLWMPIKWQCHPLYFCAVFCGDS